MKISAKLTAIIFAAIAAFASVSCEKSESSIKPEEILGSFTYEGNTYNIRSVVLYPLDNGQTEIWMSETAGYTTVEQIEASVGELVISMRTADIVNGNESSENSPKENLWIKYDGTINNGMHVIKCETNESSKTISLNFRSINTDFSNKIEGSYNGPYSDYSIPDLNNQWAYNRQAQDITTADYFEMEDGKPSRLILYYKDGKAIELTIPKADVGPEIVIQAGQANKYSSTSVTYDNGEEFDIFSGEIQIITDRISKNLKVHIKLSNSAGRTLRADYKGAYRHRFGNKANRCIFDSASEGYGYNGKFLIDAMKVSKSSNEVTFTFTPGEHTTSGLTDKVLIPTLKVASELVKAGEVEIKSTAYAWNFFYHNFQVYSYDAAYEDRTTANPGSIMNIECDDNGMYTVNLEVSYMIPKIVTTDKVDENGNIVYEDVQKKDENGIPLFDKDDNPIMEQVPVKIQTTIDVPASIDLFFKEQAN